MELNRKKQAIVQTSEACSNMIVGVRQLRLSVLDLFTTLADNGPDPHRNHQINQENLFASENKLYYQQRLSTLATSHTLCTSSTPTMRAQKQQEQQQQQVLIQYVNQMISSLTATIRGLDQDIMILMQNHALINPGESIHLGYDCSLDKHNLYMDLCKSYKTFTKLHDYSTTCHSLLLQQSLRRVHKRYETHGGPSQQQSRADSIVATFNPYTYGMSATMSVQAKLGEALKKCEFMEGSYSQPFGCSTGVFQISVNRILKAVLVMRDIVIDAVIVKAYHESFATKASKVGSSASLLAANSASEAGGGTQFVDADDDIDLWSESKYAVFRKLTHHANAAVLHFQYPSYPEIAVKSFLSWFNSYSNLFSAKCSRCDSKLRKFMPPICRDFSSGFQPHHDSCK